MWALAPPSEIVRAKRTGENFDGGGRACGRSTRFRNVEHFKSHSLDKLCCILLAIQRRVDCEYNSTGLQDAFAEQHNRGGGHTDEGAIIEDWLDG